MNKKLTLMGIAYMIFTVLFSVGVLATGVTTTDLSLGGAGQPASNPEDDDGPEVISVTGTVIFDTLPGAETKIKVSDITLLSSKYSKDLSLSFSNPVGIENILKNSPGLFVVEVDPSDDTIDGSLPPDNQITIRVMIPANLDAINNLFQPAAFEVGEIIFSEALTPFTSITGKTKITLQRENQLEIQDIDADVDGKKQSIDDGDNIENLKPGDSIEFDVEIENNFDKKSKLEIENVDLGLDCDSNDFDIDDSSVDVGDIQEDDSQIENMRGQIEDDAEDNTIGCDLNVAGEDLNGAKHGDTTDFGLEVDRKNHDIQLKSINANPSSLVCEDTSFQLSVGLINLGTSDEDGIALDVTSKTLGLNQRVISNLELNEDDTSVEIATIAIDPTSIKSGTYAIQLQSFYDNVKLSDTEVIQVENLCTVKDDELETDNGNDDNDGGAQTPLEKLSLDQDVFKSSISKTISIPVQLSNTENSAVEYTLSLVNTDEFAEPASTKSVFLNPGQTSTVFLNLKIREDVADGKYSGTVKLAQAGQTVDTASFAVDVTGSPVAADKGKIGAGLTLGEGSSKVFWIIGDIILIVIAIFFIRLIFMSGKGKDKRKKMADYEAQAKKR